MGEAPRSPARIVATDGDFEGMAYELVADETMIGRNSTADISLLDDGMSREHAIISYEEASGEYVVDDLQSTNGTKVNGKRVRSAPLSPNDEIRIGNTTFRFELN
ncbi:MAG: pSer/pThr/pTyr-binding forkhead associated (FHA) protein [Myxococcota bacterium]|jgi:pSer/pThr/pTyr-binding forkhead associated (FHA) protein